MKRLVAFLLCIILCLSMAACRQQPDPTPVETNEETLKVGIICTSDPADPYSEAAAYTAQLKEALGYMGVEETALVVHHSVSTSNSALAQEAIEACVQEGCAVIFGTSEGYAQAMQTKAQAYPRVTFVGLGTPVSSIPNYFAVRLKMYAGAYLCGIVAAFRSESGKLGLIASADTTNAETCQIANAFLLGAQLQNPDATLTVVAAATQADEAAAVEKLKTAGCDAALVSNAISTTAELVQMNGMIPLTLYTTQAQKDNFAAYSASPYLINLFADTLQCVLAAETPYYNNRYLGMADGFMQTYTGFFGEREPEGDIEVLPDAVRRQMMSGKFDPFSGQTLHWELGELTATPTALKDAAGAEKIAAGAGTPTGAVLFGMTWLIAGITVA